MSIYVFGRPTELFFLYWTLEPLSMKLSPSLLADVDIDAASLPESGSVRQYEASLFIEAKSGSHFSFRALEPYVSIIHAHMLQKQIKC